MRILYRMAIEMNIVVIDGQGGKMGAQLIKAILERFPSQQIAAVGTNTAAAALMLKSGASHAATGENAVKVACRKADVIIGPLGIVIADSLYGEITPAMALAVAQSDAVRILLPVNKCDNIVVGVESKSMSQLIDETLERLAALKISQ